MSHGNEMICQPVTLSGYAEWPKVADAVIEAINSLFLLRFQAFLVCHDRIGVLDTWGLLSADRVLDVTSLPSVTRLWSVFALLAVLRFVHFLRRGDERPVLGHPSLPCVPGLIGRPEIVRFPDAPVFRCERIPVDKVPLRHLTSKRLGIPEQLVNIWSFPFLEQLGVVGTVGVGEAIGMNGHTRSHRTFGIQG